MNLVLFFVKLYVSLSSNSISIWSDAVNNLSDFLSCLLSAVCMLLSVKLLEKRLDFVAGRLERLLSLLLSLVVTFVGLAFAYSSLERFMYPTPIWFAVKFAVLIAITAFAKLLLFFFFRSQYKKSGSPVIKVMSTDSLLDFFITLTSLLSFTLTRYTEFAVDAVFGLLISVIVTVNAAKLLYTSVCGTIGFVKESERKKLSLFFEENKISVSNTVFFIEGDESISAFVTAEPPVQKDREALKKECFEKTGIKITFAE